MLDRAKVPSGPFGPLPRRDAALAGVIGMLFGVVLALLRTPEIITREIPQSMNHSDFVGNFGMGPNTTSDRNVRITMNGTRKQAQGWDN